MRTSKIPTADDVKATAKQASPIEPQQAVIVHCFVENYGYSNEANKAVYECMNEADKCVRNSIAIDVATEYCNSNGIKWSTIRVLSVERYGKHFTIEAIATL